MTMNNVTKTVWRRVKLGNVCPTVFSGGTPDTRIATYWSGDLPWLSSGETRKAFINETDRKISEEAVKNSSTRWAKRGDVVIASAGQGHTRGQVSFLMIDTLINQSIVVFRPNQHQLHSLYLFYNLRLRYDEIRALSDSSSTRGSITGPLMKNLDLYIPSEVSKQKEIASILFSYDQLIENNKKRIKALEEMAQLLYTEWFVKFKFPGHEKVKMVDSGTAYGMIPERWTVKTLKEISKEIKEPADPNILSPDTPYVGLEHIPRKSIALTSWGCATDVSSTKLRFKRGDVLFGKIRPYFHKVVSAPIEGIASSDTVIFRANQPHLQPVVLMCTSSAPFVAYATSNSQGTKMPRADWKSLSRYLIALPQDGILTTFSQVVGQMEKEITNLVFLNRNLQRIRDLLIPLLVTGKRFFNNR